MKKFLVVLAGVILVIVISGYATVKIKNRPPEDLYSVYLKQGLTPAGKTAVFLIGLSTTEDFDYRPFVAQAMFDALDAVLSRSGELVANN